MEKILQSLRCLPALMALLLSACEPPKDPASDVGALGSDVPLPLLDHQAEVKAGTEILLLQSDGAEPYQIVQSALLADMVRSTPGLGFRADDAKGDARTQAAQLREAISRQPQTIFVVPVDVAALEPMLAEARGLGAQVIGLDPRIPEAAASFTVFCDQAKVAGVAAGAMRDALKRKAADEGRADGTGRVVQLWIEDHAPSATRAGAFEKTLAAQPGIVLVHDAPTRWNREAVTQRMREAFRLQKAFDIVYAHNDLIAAIAADASREAGQRENLFIMGTDALGGVAAGLDMVREGVIDASVHQPLLVDFAWRVSRRMIAEPDFRPKPRYEIEPFFVSPKNLVEILAKGPKYPEM